LRAQPAPPLFPYTTLFRSLAAGNIGVMAATNATVKAKETMILTGVFAAVLAMCLLTFRSVVGTILVVLPLALVSVLVYAVMAVLDRKSTRLNSSHRTISYA